MLDVFISYSRKDKVHAERFQSAITGLGLQAFRDVTGLHAGEDFTDQLDAALRNSKVVLGLWSQSSLSSRFCLSEFGFANKSNKLLPVAIEEFDQDSVRFDLQRSHYIRLIGEGAVHSLPEWPQLVAALNRHLGTTLKAELSEGQIDREFSARFSIREVLECLTVSDLRELASHKFEVSLGTGLSKDQIIDKILNANLKRTWMLGRMSNASLQRIMEKLGSFRRTTGLRKNEMILEIAEEMIG